MKRNDKILIFGAGGHGKVVLDILLENRTNVSGFLDEDNRKIGKKINGFEVLGDWSYLEGKSYVKIALGIGNNEARWKVYHKTKSLGVGVISAIHPKAIISQDVKMGEGIVVMPGAVVNPGAVLENGVVVNTGATVDHDCYLEQFCQIWPGAHLAGTVKVGGFSYIGTGASVIQNIKIGKNVIIGAGAAVISDIPDEVTVVGVPAKVIKRNV
ncbi:MAG: acetyltransferase [bacterium]